MVLSLRGYLRAASLAFDGFFFHAGRDNLLISTFWTLSCHIENGLGCLIEYGHDYPSLSLVEGSLLLPLIQK
jgi:hypothetical protein